MKMRKLRDGGKRTKERTGETNKGKNAIIKP